jgi:hypothetical protein
LVATAVATGIAAILTVFFVFRASRVFVRVVLAVIAVACALPLVLLLAALKPELVDVRFRTYKNFYADIKEGMTRGEVLAAMEQRYPPGGSRQRPHIARDEPFRLDFFLNTESPSEASCEGIFLDFEGGRVSKKQYSPD